MKTNNSTASISTELTDAPESKLTINPDIIMESDKATNSINAVSSDSTINSTTPTNINNLFDNEQTPSEVTAVINTTVLPKQQRIGKQQRKSDFADFKETYLMPSKLMKRHSVNIEESVWEQLERVARILGDRGSSVGSYINAILLDYLKTYASDIEVWRKV